MRAPLLGSLAVGRAPRAPRNFARTRSSVLVEGMCWLAPCLHGVPCLLSPHLCLLAQQQRLLALEQCYKAPAEEAWLASIVGQAWFPQECSDRGESGGVGSAVYNNHDNNHDKAMYRRGYPQNARAGPESNGENAGRRSLGPTQDVQRPHTQGAAMNLAGSLAEAELGPQKQSRRQTS